MHVDANITELCAPKYTRVEEDNNNYVTYKFRYNYGDFVTPLVCATRL